MLRDVSVNEDSMIDDASKEMSGFTSEFVRVDGRRIGKKADDEFEGNEAREALES